MKYLTSLNFVSVLLLCSVSMTVQAQQVYRCGKTYSQIPCAGGKVVDTRDVRTPKQRAEARKAAARDSELADELQKAREQEEAMVAAGSTPTEKPAKAKNGKSEKPKAKKSKKNEPELFTAAAPSEKKKKKTSAPVP